MALAIATGFKDEGRQQVFSIPDGTELCVKILSMQKVLLSKQQLSLLDKVSLQKRKASDVFYIYSIRNSQVSIL